MIRSPTNIRFQPLSMLDSSPRNSKLRRDNRQLRDHLAIAGANIQRLATTNSRLQAQLEAAAGITRLDIRRSLTRDT
jgi:hypothetical protein